MHLQILSYILVSIWTICVITITVAIVLATVWLLKQKIATNTQRYTKYGQTSLSEEVVKEDNEPDLASINAHLDMKRAERIMANSKMEISEGNMCEEEVLDEHIDINAINNIRNIK